MVSQSPVTNFQEAASALNWVPYSASTGGVSWSGSTETDTSMTFEPRSPVSESLRAVCWNVALSIGQASVQCVYTKSISVARPASDWESNAAPLWSVSENFGSAPKTSGAGAC